MCLNWAVSINRENRGRGPLLACISLSTYTGVWLQLVMDFRESEVNCVLWNF